MSVYDEAMHALDRTRIPELESFIAHYDVGQRARELIWLYTYVQFIAPKTILEIGSMSGGHLLLLGTLLDEDGLLVSVDTDDRIRWDFDSYECDVYKVIGDSHKIKGPVMNTLKDRPVDLLFIDGDHSAEGVRQDFADYAPLVHPGGIIALHDIRKIDGIRSFWETLGDQRFESPRHTDEIGIGFIIK